MRSRLSAFAIIVTASCYLLWPLLTCHGSCIVDFDTVFAPDHLTGPLRAADTRLNVWILWWVQHALTTDPRTVFDGNAYWPASGALAGSEHMLSLAAATLPLRLLTGDAVSIYDGALVLTFVVAGLSVCAMVRWLTGDATAAVCAALAAMLMPWRVSELVHIQLLTAGLMPLVWLYAARVLLDEDPRRAAFALAGLWLIELFASYYVAFFALVSTATFVVVVAAATRARPARVAAFGVATLLPVLALAAWSLPYLRLQRSGALVSSDQLARSLSPAWVVAALTPGTWLGAGPGPWARGYELPACVLVLAAVGLTAIVVAVWRHPRDGRVREWPAEAAAGAGLLAAMVVAFVLCVGESLRVGGVVVSMPANWASALLPGLASLRGPMRWAIVIGVATPVLAGVGIAALRRAAPSRYGASAVTAALIALLAVDLAPPHLVTVPVYAAHAAELAGLRTLARLEDGPVLDVPMPQNPLANAVASSAYLVASTVHGKPILAGYTAYAPSHYGFLLRAGRGLPEAGALQRLQKLTALRWVVLHGDALADAERAAWEQAAFRSPMVLAYHDDALSVYELAGAPSDPAAREAMLATTPRPSTVFGLSREPLVLRPQDGTLRARLPGALPGYPGDWTKAAVNVQIENHGSVAWPGLDPHRAGLVLVRYRLLRTDGTAALEGVADLDADIAAGGSLSTWVVVEGTAAPGQYRLELSLVQQLDGADVALPFPPVVGDVSIVKAG